MRIRKITLAVLLVTFLTSVLSSCGNSPKNDKMSNTGSLEKIEVSISGMTCTGCEQKIMSNVGKLEGIKSVTASYKDGKAIIEFISSMTDTLKIKNAITAAGYSVQKFNNAEAR